MKKWYSECSFEHHSLNFMRTNNENVYKYTNFPYVIQQCDIVEVQWRIMSEEPGFKPVETIIGGHYRE